ncbi:hypothetical protein QZH41_008497, partial [Actinostola sp. cb2023]
FPGNTDKNTVVKNILDIPVHAKLIRFIPTKWYAYKTLRVEVYGLGVKGCQDVAVGVADKNIIPDSSFTASSYYDSSYAPKGARLYLASAWAPKDNSNANDYLQIDLGKVFVICALATQGQASTSSLEWTTEYKISTSIDNNLWNTYPSNTSPKLFPGNTDKHTIVKNILDIPVQAKLIRFIPTKYHNRKAVRVEVYGLGVKDFSCRSLPVGVASVATIPDNSMTSSSNYNTSTPPSNGRLGYTAGSSWCSAPSDPSPYLQIKLGSSYIICGVATQGDHKTHQWVQTYHIQKSIDGSTFTDYKQNNLVKRFDSSFDSDTVVNNLLYGGTTGQYIRITPKSNNYGSTSCMRTELYGVQTTVCTKMAVGLSYSIVVPDHRFTASSFYDQLHEPRFARLVTSSRAWSSKTTAGGDWLQIDLGSVVYLCAVATQGTGASLSENEFVKTYKLKLSMDNINWEYYQQNNADKVFTGNTDRSTIVTNPLTTPAKAKFVRFYSITHHSWTSLRVEVYGIPTACRSHFGVEKGGIIQSNHMSSSSHVDNTHTPSHGRLYGDTSWCSTASSNTEYLQINLGNMVTLTGLATQGDRTMDKWVKNYTFNYSMDGNMWTTYRGGLDSVKVIQGNTNKNSIIVTWLSHPTTARHVRVLPRAWNTAICMRIELYGCTCPSAPDITEFSNQNLTSSGNAHVDLTCKGLGQLIQYIEWYSDGIDVTSLSGGMTRGANYVKSVLRVNYTTADDVVAKYQCSQGSGSVTCRNYYICRAKYGKDDGYADGIKAAGIQVRLDYPPAVSLPSVDNILVKSVRVRWTQPVLTPSQASVQSYVIWYWNNHDTKTDSVAYPATNYTISGLTACTYYNVTIKAVSKLGDGPWSNTKTFRTGSD